VHLLVLLGFGLSVWLLLGWRREQWKGHGLLATYYEGTGFKAPVIRSAVEPILLFSDATHAHFRRENFSAIWTGTIVLPRTGRYVFATESDDGSFLEIDGRTVVSNGGLHEIRRVETVEVLPAGPHAIRIRYLQDRLGASLRVFWTPAGRRGGLEYIPPTLLFPHPPAEVAASRARSVPPRDAPTVVLLGLALLVTCLLLGRRQVLGTLRALRRERGLRLDLLLFSSLLLAGLAVRLWNLSGAGQTWDEDVYFAAGRNFVNNLLDGHRAAALWAWNLEHPALAKWLYGPAALLSDSFGPPRAVAAFVGALTCAFAFLAGRDLVSRGVGFLAGALCVVMPHVVAHGKVMGLEAPSGLLFTLGLWLFYRATVRGGNSGYHLAAGLCAGLAVATRVLNVSLMLAMLLLYLGANWREIRRERHFPLPLTLGLLPFVALLVFFGTWPYLWYNPLQHLGEMLSHWKPDAILEFFLGQQRDAPLYYFPLYFAVTMPAGALFALPLFFGRAAEKRGLGHLTLGLWLLCPFLVALSPMSRDGVRYLYPALIAACVASAAGLDWLARGVSQVIRRPAVHRVTLAVLGVSLGLYVLQCGLSVHPYYLDYYNELVGGPAEVERKRTFEIAWWGEGLREATTYIGRVAPRGARVQVFANPRHLIELRPDLVWQDDMNADYIVYNRLFNPPLRAPKHHVAHVVRAGRAPLVWVYERNSF
jgi:hypothetical protein